MMILLHCTVITLVNIGAYGPKLHQSNTTVLYSFCLITNEWEVRESYNSTVNIIDNAVSAYQIMKSQLQPCLLVMNNISYYLQYQAIV